MYKNTDKKGVKPIVIVVIVITFVYHALYLYKNIDPSPKKLTD